MSIKIKFRAWDRTGSRNGVMVTWDELKLFPCGDVFLPSEIVMPEVTLMQFSGLTDKNGTEIFEGDIANSVYGVGKVVRDERGFRFEFDTDSDGLWGMCTGIEGRTFEVIGNIYQNPEKI